jgi:hypothetical protein
VRTAAQDQAAFTWSTVSEVAVQLRVSAGQVRAFIQGGELEAMDVAAPGSRLARYRICPESVRRFVARRTRRAA